MPPPAVLTDPSRGHRVGAEAGRRGFDARATPQPPPFLFLAIRFVIGDVFSTLRADDRTRLLHVRERREGEGGREGGRREPRRPPTNTPGSPPQEGAGAATATAYVELVFDNSDNRFPVDRSEVRVRRTVGVKKDEFALDKRPATKAEVQSLLEAAGFSRANPYYVVQQGKVGEGGGRGGAREGGAPAGRPSPPSPPPSPPLIFRSWPCPP